MTRTSTKRILRSSLLLLFAGFGALAGSISVVPSPNDARGSIIENVKAGLSYAYSNSTLRFLMLGTMVMSLTVGPFQSLMPVFAEDAGKVQSIGARFAQGEISLEYAADMGCRACGSPGGGCQFFRHSGYLAGCR